MTKRPSIQLPLYLSLMLLAPLGANAADSISDTLKKIESIRASAEKDIDFVLKNAPNCVAGDRLEKLREMALKPSKVRIQQYARTLQAGYADVAEGEDNACRAINKEQADKALAAANAVNKDIEDFSETMAAKAKEVAYFYTYDELMMKALAAADGYPKCVPEDANDVNSTPESKRYLKFKDRLSSISEGMAKLRKQVKDRLKNGC